jgi:hypothetical protein
MQQASIKKGLPNFSLLPKVENLLQTRILGVVFCLSFPG